MAKNLPCCRFLNALLTQSKIIIEEPARTLATYGCALVSLLPHSLYRMLENLFSITDEPQRS
jgi:hypothetical protein